MFGISFEHLLIVGVILIIVGPRRLPELGNTMGKAIKNFKDSFSGVEEASFKKLNNNNNQSTNNSTGNNTATADNVDPVTPVSKQETRRQNLTLNELCSLS